MKILMFCKDTEITSAAARFLQYHYPNALIKHEIDREVYNWFGDYILSFINPIILPKWLLDRASKGAINWHTCLPKYPGTGGYSMALLNNDYWSGITVHYMDEKIDHGTLIDVIPFEIPVDCTIEGLKAISHDKALNHFIVFVMHVLPGWINNKDFKRADMLKINEQLKIEKPEVF